MRTLCWFLLILIPFFYACEVEVLPEAVNYGEDQVYKQGQYYYSADKVLKFIISGIRDSRCPTDVVCLWQGEAEVGIKIESSGSPSYQDSISLSTYDNLVDTLGMYSFELKDVSPYPVSTREIEQKDYRIRLLIKKLE